MSKVEVILLLLHNHHIPQSGSESVEVSVLQSSLADNNWHSLTVVVNGSMANFYQDASLINSRYIYFSYWYVG